jgi:DNA-binding GntR family transcriptional regulator
VTKNNQADQIYNALLDSILAKKLSPGTRLTEEKLADFFSVSRTIIRGVLQRLDSEDIVVIERNKGAIVATTTPELAVEYLTARRFIEAQMIKLATPNITQADMVALEILIDKEHKARESGEMGKALRLSAEFHITIASLANNTPMADFAKRMICRCELIAAQYQSLDGSQCLHHDHFEILAAMSEKNADKAMALILEHLEKIESRLYFDGNTLGQPLEKILCEYIRL